MSSKRSIISPATANNHNKNAFKNENAPAFAGDFRVYDTAWNGPGLFDQSQLIICREETPSGSASKR